HDCRARPSGRRRLPRSRTWARSGSGPPAASPATRDSWPTPTASTPRCSSEATTACCAAARGRATRVWPPPPFVTGTTPSVARYSPACASPETRPADGASPIGESDPLARTTNGDGVMEPIVDLDDEALDGAITI